MLKPFDEPPSVTALVTDPDAFKQAVIFAASHGYTVFRSSAGFLVCGITMPWTITYAYAEHFASYEEALAFALSKCSPDDGVAVRRSAR